ncbi:MAG: homoserine kinase [Alphaproteobacteria bacterium]|nr:homoserine kinase [Alphaproteobacteria bacterium SS10]
MAVYTDVSDEALAEFFDQYDLGEVISCKGIAEGVENSNYLVVTTQGPHILTLYEKRVNPSDLPFFLGLMEHLAARDFACPLPIAAKDGEALRELCGRPAAVISFLQGMWPRRIQPHHCAGLGKAMAQMHAAAVDFSMTRPNDLSLNGWETLVEQCKGRADQVQPGLCAGIEAELEYLQQHWPTDLPRGIIHADLFPDNVFFRKEDFSGVIDFYFACEDFFAYEVAICMNAWCFEPDVSFNVTKARQMLKNYQTVRPLSAAELNALPLLARGSALRFLLTRLYDWLNHPEGAMVTPKDPLEYWRKLQFHQAVDGLGAYGLATAEVG